MNAIRWLLLDMTGGHRCNRASVVAVIKAMYMQRESVCCHDIEEIKSLIDDAHIEMASILHYTACKLQ